MVEGFIKGKIPFKVLIRDLGDDQVRRRFKTLGICSYTMVVLPFRWAIQPLQPYILENNRLEISLEKNDIGILEAYKFNMFQ